MTRTYPPRFREELRRHTVSARMTLEDAAAWVLYEHQNDRANEEYEHSPLTHRNVTGPCLRRCGRTAYTQIGICRYCPKGEQ